MPVSKTLALRYGKRLAKAYGKGVIKVRKVVI